MTTYNILQFLAFVVI